MRSKLDEKIKRKEEFAGGRGEDIWEKSGRKTKGQSELSKGKVRGAMMNLE
jgi:hypothetical protein